MRTENHENTGTAGVIEKADQIHIDAYLNRKKQEGWSQTSIQRAEKRLADFCAFVCGIKDNCSEKVLKNEMYLMDWEERLVKKNLSQRTIGEYMSAARQFIHYLETTDALPANDEAKSCKNQRSLDLTGQRFGELKVLEPCKDKRSVERSVIWKCQCSCGKIIEVPANNLKKGFYTSCGCKRAERLKETNQYIDGTSLKMVFSDTIRKDNTSGCKGVFRKQGRWAVRIQYKGERYYLGAYDKLDDAIRVRKIAEEKVRDDAEKLRIKG